MHGEMQETFMVCRLRIIRPDVFKKRLVSPAKP